MDCIVRGGIIKPVHNKAAVRRALQEMLLDINWSEESTALEFRGRLSMWGPEWCQHALLPHVTIANEGNPVRMYCSVEQTIVVDTLAPNEIDTHTIDSDLKMFWCRNPLRRRYERTWVQNGYECTGDGMSFAFRRSDAADCNPNEAPDILEFIQLAEGATCDHCLSEPPPYQVCKRCGGSGYLEQCQECSGNGCIECCDTGKYYSECSYCIHGHQTIDDSGKVLLYALVDASFRIDGVLARRLYECGAQYSLVRRQTASGEQKLCVWRAKDILGVVGCVDDSDP